MLQAEITMDRLIPSLNFNRWKARIPFWARDTAIWRNMTTNALKNVCSMSHSHEVQVVGPRDELLDTEDVIRELWTGCPRPRDVPP
jgi:hypothetical protein